MTSDNHIPAEINASQTQAGGAYVLYDSSQIDPPPAEFFDAEYWSNQGKLLSTAEGRGAACIFAHVGREYVLRHYRRGGLVARLSEDMYRWSGLESTRPWREWFLLREMYQQGLPVPRPVAARVVRKGLFYTADLVTLCLPNVKTLADFLMESELPGELWMRLGRTVNEFHGAGVYHADLNARNILLDDGKRFFIIDFDKGERRTPKESWQNENTDRLKRSLNKFKSSQAVFHFDEDVWRCFLQGYQAA